MSESRVTKVLKSTKSADSTADKAIDIPVKKSTYHRKIHYVSSSTFDINNLRIGITFYEKANNVRMMFTYDYEYLPGLISRLNILHENSRIYASRALEFLKLQKRHDSLENIKINAPIRYDNEYDMMLKSALDLIKEKLIEFLIFLKNSELDFLCDKYTNNNEKYARYLSYMHKWLQKRNTMDLEGMFEVVRRNLINDPDEDNLDDSGKKRADPETYRLLPKLKSTTNIIKLGSKKSGYVNEDMNLISFLTEHEPTYKMNYPDSEYFFESNMVINISSHCVGMNCDYYRINFSPICSTFEYKLNKASAKRVIKKKQIEKPIVLRSLRV